ncbi:MAG: ribonuclease III domain-containing protein [Absicoccus sp.]|uniref:Mini-ribonuclease 3 n=1 Tax=Absicoccus sp. TaxID=2718527 RepID=UPI002A756D7F|nr:ribonuclease III domain-containing protein [Absicoccus sp.]MDY3035080.1 ribonuclease III domain-containing protein [Absicoccus sp.]
MEIVHQNAISLAWMGDAIMTMYVRQHILEKGIQNPQKLQRMSAKVCSAKGQSALLDALNQEDFFTADEKEILRRGRNASYHTKAKNATSQQYMKATALEACIGYLYLYDHVDRLHRLMDRIIQLGDQL